jgi:multiple antibiotic resistance protein
MSLIQIIENSLYFLVLINPITKVLFITAKTPPYSRKELTAISIRATVAALLILIILASFGDDLLINIFHVEIYSLSVAGGVILFIIGLTAIKKGIFFEEKEGGNKQTDISIVPLAAPLIAGPGTMTAAISFASTNGSILTIICITIAALINFVIMLFSTQIHCFLEKFNATETLMRITGLIVAAVAMQMIFSGCSAWLIKLSSV